MMFPKVMVTVNVALMSERNSDAIVIFLAV